MSAKCGACYHHDLERHICTRDGCVWCDKYRDEDDPGCSFFLDSWERFIGVRQDMQLPAVSPQIAAALAENVDQMGRYIMQLGQLVGSMQRRMDEMEKAQAAVTIRHEDVKRLQALIRMRADQICGKYNLQDKDSPRIFRAAIKKDLMKRCGVKDLHDVPAAMLGGAENMISGWTNIRMAMERRAKA